MINNNKHTLSFVKNISFLKKIPEKSLDLILESAAIKNIKKDEILFLEGDEASKFYIILNGSFKLFNETISGNESVTRLLSNGDFFGEKSLSDDPFYSSSAEATKNSQILEIPSKSLKNQIEFFPVTGMVLLQEILNCQSKLESQIEYLSIMNATQRIGWYLIHNAIKNKNILGRVSLQHEKAVIATFLGMKPETFSRAIKKLKEVDVHVNGAEIVIKNIDLLQKFCTEKFYAIENKDFKYNN